MDREALERLIRQAYAVEADRPWASYPNYTVFRHPGSRKWFALVMDVPGNRLGLPGAEPLDVVDLKCEPRLLGSLLGEPGCFPAYHMSKGSWITLALDGSAPDDLIQALLSMSYDLTAPRPARRRGN